MSTSDLFLSIEEIPSVFHDLEPVPQDECAGAVAQIDYSAEFIKAYDYQRAVWRANEKNTHRALKLTAVCLRLNPANYTVWHFRRLCLQDLYSDDVGDFSFVKDEMALAAMLGGDNPKNYQIWYHRRALLERIAAASKALGSTANDSDNNVLQYYQDELDYIATVVRADGKNYHAWSHRQWVATTISKTQESDQIWTEEAEFSDALIQMDLRNNSAWNHRWFATHRGLHRAPLDLAVATEEAEYALSIAQIDCHNESPWRYLVAVLKEQVLSSLHAEKVKDFLSPYYSKAKEIELQSAEKQDTGASDTFCCPNLDSFLIDILELIGDSQAISEAISVAKGLADEHDMIRRKYWNLRISKLEQKL